MFFTYGSTPEICLWVVDCMDSSIFKDLLDKLTAHDVAAYVSIDLIFALYMCSLTFIKRGDLAFKIERSSTLASFALWAALFTCFEKLSFCDRW